MQPQIVEQLRWHCQPSRTMLCVCKWKIPDHTKQLASRLKGVRMRGEVRDNRILSIRHVQQPRGLIVSRRLNESPVGAKCGAPHDATQRANAPRVLTPLLNCGNKPRRWTSLTRLTITVERQLYQIHRRPDPLSQGRNETIAFFYLRTGNSIRQSPQLSNLFLLAVAIRSNSRRISRTFAAFLATACTSRSLADDSAGRSIVELMQRLRL